MPQIYAEPRFDLTSASLVVALRQQRRQTDSRDDEMQIVHVDGLPYVSPDWLRRRIADDQAREQRWLARASAFEHRRDDSGMALRAAYLSHALDAEYRAIRRRRELEEVLRAGGEHAE